MNLERDANLIVSILADIPSEGSGISEDEDEESPIQIPIVVAAEIDDDEDPEFDMPLSDIQRSANPSDIVDVPAQEAVSNEVSSGVQSLLMKTSVPGKVSSSRRTRDLVVEPADTSSIRNLDNIAEPKWRHRVRAASPPEQFNTDTSLPTHISQLQDPTPATLFKLFWPKFVGAFSLSNKFVCQQEGRHLHSN
ncbi:unnamed protein product [Parnassius apollo]|uniref:(apollo) hypothetical protein n=1 Tax=Parnassius apollo TaxID=110799 RepID=A0A8S3XEE4_PARAO|nr:unnamed protein product [Parnassius apollo]